MKYDSFRTVQNLKQLQSDILGTKTKNMDDKYRHYCELEKLICLAKSKELPSNIIKTIRDNGLVSYVAFK